MAVYRNFIDSFFRGEHDLVSDDLRVILLDSGYTIDKYNHTTYSDVVAHEVSGTGYSAGGALLDNKQWSRSGSWYELTARDVGWFNPSISPRYAVLYNDSHASDELIGYYDLGSTLNPNGVTMLIEWGEALVAFSYTGYIYGNILYHCGLGQADLMSDTIKCALLKQTYAPDTTGHTTYSDISAYEVTGTGYTAGGVTTPSTNLVVGGDHVIWDIVTGIAWPDLDLNNPTRYAVLYDSDNVENTLIYYEDLGSDIDPGGKSFYIPIESGGVFTYVG